MIIVAMWAYQELVAGRNPFGLPQLSLWEKIEVFDYNCESSENEDFYDH